MKVPFNRQTWPFALPDEPFTHQSGDGPFTKRATQILSDIMGGSAVMLTTSCTHALEMSALLLNIQPGEEVIVPSFTFVSTANAFVLRGAVPIFADCRPDTLNMDETLLPDLITSKTRAIVPVHYAGVACEMDAIMGLASSHGIKVIEDNAHGLFGSYRGKKLGTFGALATQSFHETKNISCGEGGALIINDSGYHQRAEIVREKGTNRSRFFRGEIDKYSWVDVGSSYLPSDILAAVLLSQLEMADQIQAKRRIIWQRYNTDLAGWMVAQGVRGPIVPQHCGQPFHMYYMLMPDLETRTRFIEFLKARGVSAVFHYLPLSTSVMGLRLGGRIGQCPVAENASDRLVRLPLFADLTSEEQDAVIDAVHSFS